MKLRNVLTSILCACTFTVVAAAQSSWTADRTLRIEFRMPAAQWPIEPNTFVVAGGYVTIQQPHTQLTLTMYNGSTLMGTAISRSGAGYTGAYSYHGFGTSFQTAGSTFSSYLGTPAIIDFTPLLDRTIQGRIDVNIDAGRILIDLNQVYLSLSQYVPARPIGGQSVYPSPVITSVKLIPEIPTEPPPPPPAVDPGPPVFGPSDNSIISPTQLRSYCDQAKGTAIIFQSHVTIKGTSSSEVVVNRGCTIELAPNVNLVAENAVLKFAGPLTIQTQGKAGLSLLKSRITAPGIAVTYPGADSMLTSSESTLRSDGGPLTIAVGDQSKIEIFKRYSGQSDALWSTHQLTIGAGRKFEAGFLGANVRGNLGILIDIAGEEAAVKSLDGNVFSAPQGTVRIAGTGAKSMVEMSDTQAIFGDSLAFTLTGNESTVKLIKTTLGPSSGTATAGITIQAGANGVSLGTVEGSEVTLRNARSASVTAATNGNGLMKWEKGSANLTGDVLFQGGSTTEVKDSNITSTTVIRIFTRAGGSCSGAANSLSAPVIQICPAF